MNCGPKMLPKARTTFSALTEKPFICTVGEPNLEPLGTSKASDCNISSNS